MELEFQSFFNQGIGMEVVRIQESRFRTKENGRPAAYTSRCGTECSVL
jgi:hypothetical protein